MSVNIQIHLCNFTYIFCFAIQCITFIHYSQFCLCCVFHTCEVVTVLKQLNGLSKLWAWRPSVCNIGGLWSHSATKSRNQHVRIARCLGYLHAETDPDSSILWSQHLLRKTIVLHFVSDFSGLHVALSQHLLSLFGRSWLLATRLSPIMLSWGTAKYKNNTDNSLNGQCRAPSGFWMTVEIITYIHTYIHL